MAYIVQLVLLVVLYTINKIFLNDWFFEFLLLFLLPGAFMALRLISQALKDADNFRPINLPRTLFIDKKTNTWQTGFISDRTLKKRVFWNSIKGKPS